METNQYRECARDGLFLSSHSAHCWAPALKGCNHNNTEKSSSRGAPLYLRFWSRWFMKSIFYNCNRRTHCFYVFFFTITCIICPQIYSRAPKLHARGCIVLVRAYLCSLDPCATLQCASRSICYSHKCYSICISRRFQF